MKKFLSLFLALVMVLALAVPVLAAPPSTNANRNPGTYVVVTPEDITVRIGGNGNSARLIAYVDGVQVFVSAARPANNRYNIIEVAGIELGVFVRGNSILHVTVISEPAPEPVVTYVWDFVENVLIRTDFDPWTEVVGTRSVGDGLNVVSTFTEVNFSDFPRDETLATGSGVIAGFSATGTLTYDWARSYQEILQRSYNYVRVTTLSGVVQSRVVVEEAVLRGDEFNGVSGTASETRTRVIDVSGGEARLTGGGGQGYPDSATVSGGGISLTLTLANQRPTVNVSGVVIDITAL